MTLRKDDPVYYKKKLTELIKQAKENGLVVSLEGSKIIFKREINFMSNDHSEQTSVDLGEV